jgi:hypothetical protein
MTAVDAPAEKISAIKRNVQMQVLGFREPEVAQIFEGASDISKLLPFRRILTPAFFHIETNPCRTIPGLYCASKPETAERKNGKSASVYSRMDAIEVQRQLGPVVNAELNSSKKLKCTRADESRPNNRRLIWRAICRFLLKCTFLNESQTKK